MTLQGELVNKIASLERRLSYLETLTRGATEVKFTSVGGLAVRLYNRTGAASVKGNLLQPDSATDMGVLLSGANETEVVGVFLDSGIADDALAWVVVGGIAEVLLDDNTATTAGHWAQSGGAGYVDGTHAAAVPATHWQEVGHILEDAAAGGGGTHQMVKISMHFN